MATQSDVLPESAFNRWRRAGLTILLLSLLAALSALGLLSPLDSWIAAGRFSLSPLKASGQIVVVEIDSKSIAEIGVWPWSRQLHAELLDTALAMGANQVAFDIDFSSASAVDGDAAFVHSLEAAGGFAFLSAFIQPTEAGVVLTMPAAAFLAKADAGLVNVLLNSQGMADSFLTALSAGGRTVQALPALLSGKTLSYQDRVFVDFGIDVDTIDRISFVDVLRHRVDPARLAGKDVIVGASAIELHDFFRVPRFGVVSGPLLQALATETVRQGRTLDQAGPGIGIILAALVAFLLALRRRPFGLAVLAAGLVGSIVVLEAVAMAIYLTSAIVLDTAVFDLAMPGLFALYLFGELGTQIRQRRAAQNRLAYLARYDETTATLSRVGLIDAMPAMGPSGTAVLVKLIRLDNVRASLGQEVADDALRLAVRTLTTLNPYLVGYVREDTLALMFAQQLTAPALDQLCQQIETALGGTRDVEGHSVHFALALGTACGANDGDLLLRQAETALIHTGITARRSDFTDEQAKAIEFRRRLDIDLRTAIAADALHLVFQPQVNLADGRLIGAEALVRWNHPDLGAISPAVFIPLAEETGAIVDLGRWVLRQGCRQQAAWPWSGRLAINVSPIQFELSDVVEDVEAALLQAGLPADRIDVEVTEGALMRDPERAAIVLDNLSRRGIGLALDDFGTGFSALSALTSLPFDKIKIDQSFVRRFGVSPANDVLLRSIVDLCRQQGKLCVAEGIETAQQAAQLCAWGCDIGQGYFYSKPVSAPQLEVLMRDGIKPPV